MPRNVEAFVVIADDALEGKLLSRFGVDGQPDVTESTYI